MYPSVHLDVSRTSHTRLPSPDRGYNTLCSKVPSALPWRLARGGQDGCGAPHTGFWIECARSSIPGRLRRLVLASSSRPVSPLRPFARSAWSHGWRSHSQVSCCAASLTTTNGSDGSSPVEIQHREKQDTADLRAYSRCKRRALLPSRPKYAGDGATCQLCGGEILGSAGMLEFKGGACN